MTEEVSPGTCRGVCVKRLTNGYGKRCNGFTLIELIVVVGIIAILSALVLSTVGYARKKAARARAETGRAGSFGSHSEYLAIQDSLLRDTTRISHDPPEA